VGADALDRSLRSPPELVFARNPTDDNERLSHDRGTRNEKVWAVLLLDLRQLQMLFATYPSISFRDRDK
jgi:hypothetical protein